MRLFIATPLYPPESGGPATYARALEAGLPAQDVQVTLLAFSEVRTQAKFIRHVVYFWKALKLAKDADVVLALDPVSVGLPALLAAKLRRKHFVVKVVGDYAWEQGRQRFGIWQPLDEFVKTKEVSIPVLILRLVQTYVAKRASRIIVPSEYLKKIVKTWGVPDEAIEVIYNAVPPDAPGVLPEAVEALRKPRIVSVGRLVPWKGMHGLISAMPALRKQIPSAELIIVGEGPDRAQLERFARVRVKEGVHFTGALTHEETLAVLKAADVFVLNSSYEGLSHVLIEALSQGAAVVATNAGGNSELITHEENGLLISIGDPEGLAQACFRILSDDALRAHITAGARKSVERFSAETMLTKTDALLRSLPISVHTEKKKTSEVRQATSVDSDTLKVLFVSNDTALFNPASPVRARMRSYADALGELHIVSRAPRTEEMHDGALHLYGFAVGPVQALHTLTQKVRSLIVQQGITIVSAQDPFELGLVAYRAVRGTKAKLHIQIHTDFLSTGFVQGALWNSMRIKNSVRRVVADFVLPHAQGVRVVSKRIQDSLLARYGTRVPMSTILPIAVNSLFPEPIALAPHPFSFSFITISRLESEKRIEDILSALAVTRSSHPDVGLYIVGDGRERGRLEELAERLGLSNYVVFLGEDYVHALGYLRSAQAYIQASAYEGYGRTLVEAGIARVPIVTTDVGVVGELFVNGEDVWAVEPGNSSALAEAMSACVENTEDRAAMALHAQQKAIIHIEKYRNMPELIARDLEAVYDGSRQV